MLPRIEAASVRYFINSASLWFTITATLHHLTLRPPWVTTARAIFAAWNLHISVLHIRSFTVELKRSSELPRSRRKPQLDAGGLIAWEPSSDRR
jgi:hypothetical protein